MEGLPTDTIKYRGATQFGYPPRKTKLNLKLNGLD